MDKRSVLALVLSLIVLPLSQPVAGDIAPPGRYNDPSDDVALPPYGYFKGTLPVPFDNESLEGAYSNASGHSQFVPVWGRPTPFYEMAAELKGPWGEQFVDGLIRGNEMFPVININFYGAGMNLIEPPGMTGSSLASPEWRKAYHDSALDVLNASMPMYMSIGNEVNRWFEMYTADQSGNDSFLHFITLYEAIYDDIKELSPETKVYCTFSRELVSENEEANLSVLSLFDPSKLDLLVFTSYPYSLPGVDEVADLPDDYYSRAFQHMDPMPIGFSELGWPSEGPFGGEAGQAAFIRNMTGRLTLEQGLDLELLGWVWLTDLSPTDHIGLMDRSGRKKEGFNAWVNNKAPFYDRNNRTISVKEDFGTYRYDLTRTFKDPDSWDKLEYSIWNGTAYTDAYSSLHLSARIEHGDLVLTSAENRSGTKQLRVMARDWGGLTVWTYLQVIIEEVNDPPFMDPGFERLLVFGEDEYRFFDLADHLRDDNDKLDELTLQVVSSPLLVVNADLSTSSYMTIYTEVPDWWGRTYMVLWIEDTGGLSTYANFTVNVLPLNDRPILSCPAYLVTEEDTPLVRDVRNWVTDPDLGDPLFISAVPSDPMNLTVIIDGTLMTLVPAEDWHGTMVVELTVSDGVDNDSSPFELRVISVNDPPRFLRPPKAVLLEDRTYHLELGSLGPFDPEGDRLFWSVQNFTYPIGSAVILPNSTLRIEPLRDAFGPSNMTLALEDGSGGRSEITFEVEVLPVNDPPRLQVPAPWTLLVKRGGHSELALEGADYLVEDPDDPIGSLRLETGSDLVVVRGLSLKVTVPFDHPSDRFTVPVWLRDPSGAASEVRELTVIVRNGTGPGNDSILVTEFDHEISGNGKVITFMAKGNPSQTIWVVLKGQKGTTVSYLMDEVPAGSGRFVVTVKDLPFKDGETLTYHLSLTENGPNDSLLPTMTFSMHIGQDKEGMGASAILFIILIAVSFAVLLVLGAYLYIRRDKGFDLDSGAVEE